MFDVRAKSAISTQGLFEQNQCNFLRFFEYFCGSKNKYSKITDANSVFGAGSFSLINYMKNVLNGRRLNRNQAFANGVLHRRRFLAGKSKLLLCEA